MQPRLQPSPALIGQKSTMSQPSIPIPAAGSSTSLNPPDCHNLCGAQQGEAIISITPSAIINVHGHSANDYYTEPEALLLAELRNPHSRFKPYLDVLPAADELLCLCNIPEAYVGMIPEGYWVSQHAGFRVQGPSPTRTHCQLRMSCSASATSCKITQARFQRDSR